MHDNNSSEDTVTMDGFNDPSLPSTWFRFNVLADVATKKWVKRQRKRSSIIPCIKIKYDHLNPKKTVVKNHANDEGGASSLRLKFHLHPKKTVKNNANIEEVVLNDQHSFSKQECSSNKKGKKPIIYSSLDSTTEGSTSRNKKGKKPIIYSLGSATEGSTSRNEDVINNISHFKEDDHVLNMEKRNGLKRAHEDEAFINDIEENDNIDVLDQEWAPICESSSKKKQKNSKGYGNSKRQKSEDAADTVPLPPDLPQEYKNKINEMGGNQITLVIQKSLYTTDLSPQHNRLSMPLKQIKNDASNFLREEELQVLEKKQGMEVPLLQPSLELKNVTLAKWDMPKSSGATNSTYVLRSSWMKVAAANQLEQNDVVQVWSFRVQEELHMALVKVQTINV